MGGTVVFAFFLLLFVISLLSWLLFQLWWLRAETINGVSRAHGRFFIIPIVCHLFFTVAETVAFCITVLGISSGIIILVATALRSTEQLNALRSLGFIADYGWLVLLLAPATGFAVLLAARFITEWISVFAEIANNTASAELAQPETVQFNWKALGAIFRGFINKYGKPIAAVIAGVVAMFWIYSAFFKPDPQRDAKKLAQQKCDCNNSLMLKQKEMLQQINGNFDDYHFKNATNADQFFDSINKNLIADFQECEIRIESEYKERLSYFMQKNLDEPFQQQYILSSKNCEHNTEQLSVLTNEFNQKKQALKTNGPETDQIKRDFLNQSFPDFAYFNNSTEQFVGEPQVLSTSVQSEFTDLLISLKISDNNNLQNLIFYCKYYRLGNAQWKIVETHPIFRDGLGETELLENGLPFLLNGKWRFAENTATYTSNGTWSTNFSDGSSGKGTWVIRNGLISLTLNGQPYGEFKLQHTTKNQLSLTASDGTVYTAQKSN
ncbi:MAG: hypothetical protein U0T73_05055 [Chitinophagales bacterium]